MYTKINIRGTTYEIDECGNILKRRGKGHIKLWPDKDGYLRFTTTLPGLGTINKLVHRLVYETFIGVIPGGYTVDHIDSNKTNNHWSNLEAMTFEDNAIKGNARHWLVTDPHGNKHEVYNLTKFCRDNGLHRTHLHEIASGKSRIKSYKGWKCSEAN